MTQLTASRSEPGASDLAGLSTERLRALQDSVRAALAERAPPSKFKAEYRLDLVGVTLAGLCLVLEFVTPPFMDVETWHVVIGVLGILFLVSGLVVGAQVRAHAQAEHFFDLQKNYAAELASRLDTRSVEVARDLGAFGEKLAAIIVRQDPELERVGTIDDLNTPALRDRLQDLATRASRVDNTLVKPDLGTYREVADGVRRELIARVAQRNKTWKDLYSAKVAHELGPQIAELKKLYPVAYEASIIESTCRIVEHTIFTFSKSEDTEVWFGFGVEKNRGVFRTRHPDLVQYFEDYYRAISAGSRDASEPNQYDLEGSWLSVAYDGEPAFGLRDFACITVGVEDGRLRIRGKVFEAGGNHDMKQDFWSTTSGIEYVKQAGLMLNYTFTSNNRGSPVCGAARIQFDDGKRPARYEGVAFTETQRIRKVSGQRLFGEDARAVEHQEPAALARLVARLQDHVRPTYRFGDGHPFDHSHFATSPRIVS